MAKKKKTKTNNSQALKKRHQKKVVRAKALKSGGSRIQARHPQVILIDNPNPEMKYSELLRKFVAPYAEDADTEDGYRKLLIIGILAWNGAIGPPHFLDESFNALFGELGLEDKVMIREFVSELIERKHAYFSEYRGMIVDYTVEDMGGHYHITVMHTIPNAEPEYNEVA